MPVPRPQVVPPGAEPDDGPGADPGAGPGTAWKRTFWAVWIANFIAALGMQSFLPFFPRHLESLGVTDPTDVALWSGLIYGAAPLVAAFSSPFWGILGDRVGRKLMVLRSLVAIALFTAGMSAADGPVTLLLLRIGQGFFSGFVPPSITLVSVGAPANRQSSVAGSLQTALAMGTICGPVLGDLLAQEVGTRGVFLVVSALAVLAVATVAVFASEPPGATRTGGDRLTPRRFVRAALGDLTTLARSRTLRGAVLAVFLIQFAMGATNPQLELFARQIPGSGDVPFATGLLFTAVAVTAIIALPLWGRFADRVGPRGALVLCCVLTSLVFLVHGLAPVYGVLLGARFLLGASATGAGPLAFGIAAAETSVERRGGAFGVVFSARALAVALGAMAGGWLSAWIGMRALFLACAVVVLAGLLPLRKRREPAPGG